MFDVFGLLLLATVALIIGSIVAAARKTLRQVPGLRDEGSAAGATCEESMSGLVGRIRAQDVPCERCGQPTSDVLGTDRRYRCETCALEFEGPLHALAEQAGRRSEQRTAAGAG